MSKILVIPILLALALALTNGAPYVLAHHYSGQINHTNKHVLAIHARLDTQKERIRRQTTGTMETRIQTRIAQRINHTQKTIVHNISMAMTMNGIEVYSRILTLTRLKELVSIFMEMIIK